MNLPESLFTPTLASSNEVIPVLAVVMGSVIFLTSIIMGTIRRMSATKHTENTRREVAAYVAEGSMTAEEGYKLLAAGKSRGKDCDWS